MTARIMRVIAGAGAVLCLSVAVASGQSVRVIKLIRNDQAQPLELTTTELRSGKLPPPILPPETTAPVDRPDLVNAVPYSPPPPPPRFDPPAPPIHAAPAPPSHLSLPASGPPAHLTMPHGYNRPGFPMNQEPPSAPLVPAAPPASCAQPMGVILDDTQVWLRGEALLWWMRSQPLPPLVTSALPGTPPGVAGTLGGFGTSLVIGDQGINSNVRSGFRIAAGYWFECNQMTGVMADYFFLGRDSDSVQANFDGSTPLARPFLDALNKEMASEIIGFPGVVTGRATIHATASTIEGVGALLRQRLIICYDPTGTPLWRLDVVGGYRYLNLAESLSIQEDLITTGLGLGLPVGTQVVVRDIFQTRNTFHGFDMGMINECRAGPFSFELTTKLAVGSVDQRVNIMGSRTTATPDGKRSVAAGGLLAQLTNGGIHRRTEAMVIPELGVNVGWQLTPGLRVFTGYTLLFLSDVVRPGDQVDLGVNPNLLPPTSTTAGPARPAFAFQSSDMWLQGVKIGLELRY